VSIWIHHSKIFICQSLFVDERHLFRCPSFRFSSKPWPVIDMLYRIALSSVDPDKTHAYIRMGALGVVVGQMSCSEAKRI